MSPSDNSNNDSHTLNENETEDQSKNDGITSKAGKLIRDGTGRKSMDLAPCTSCTGLDRPDAPLVMNPGNEDDVDDVATKLIMEDPSYHRDLLRDMLNVMRLVDDAHVQTLLGMIRSDCALEEMKHFVDKTLKDVQDAGRDGETVERLQDMRMRVRIESGEPAFRPQVMDIHYLCDGVPYKVPAKPWTTVTDDDALVSHLISLYFTWDYPFYAFVDMRAFVQHMQDRNTNSDLCSPFLVNAMLANACYSEAYAIPGDVKTKGSDFLAEAERHMHSYQLERGRNVRLASLQATLLLYERYSMSGDDDLGYTMLNRAIDMAESLGIINGPDLDLDKLQMSEEMRSSIKRTAWGLFQVDTVVHTNFRKPSKIHHVCVERIDRDESQPSELWVPYPTGRTPRPSFLSQYFDEACRLSFIARDISHHLYQEPKTDATQHERKKEFYDKLQDWEAELPDCFDPARKPPAHIILLRMRYHAIMISLSRDGFGVHTFFSEEEGKTQTTVPPSSQLPPHLRDKATEQSLASARAIAALVRIHREEYGIGRTHPFTTYAIMVALFTMLDHASFDILDSDFLALTSAFSVIACRSQVGRNLFHIFRQSVRAHDPEARVLQSDEAPEEIKELFGRYPRSQKPDKWDDYEDGLDKLGEGEGRDAGSVDGTRMRNYAASGVRDMLKKYESLSLGHDRK
ncbi:nitrogen assimilation transcription factor nirA [Aspergillus udagawae]|uniref:Nitrogen assimilation transcription factor nirA n=1 Tax=Aspergillus udagawae TaxID=91492 RepID=A0A8H3P5R2_9EURO|nr:nitrogen assimilation transcription factor nirA [Aspergillus udagawae]